MTEPSGSAPPHAGAPIRSVARGFLALIAITSVQIVLGALVRANGAGLACPDWPLCFGELVPTFDLKVAFEWSHRLLAMIGVNFGFIGVSVWAHRRLRGSPAWAELRPLLALAAVLLVTQNVLGGLTVLQLLASWTVTLHLIFGNAFNAVLAVSAYSLICHAREPREANSQPRPAAAARAAVSLSLGLLAVQIALGGLVSSMYAGLACPDWPSCQHGVWLPNFEGALGIHLVHRWNAALLVLAILAATVLTRGTPSLARWCGLALVGALLQAAIGIANVLLRLPVEVTGLHSALAAALIVVVSLATYEAWRTPSAPRQPSASR